MATIDKKLIHFEKLADFQTRLAAGDILDYSIVYIKDAKQIWTHGTYYDASDNPSKLSELENDVDMATNESVDSKTGAVKAELTESVNALDAELTASINTVNGNLTSRINTVKTELEASMEAHRTEVADMQETHEEAVDTRLTDMQVEFETLITEHRDYMYGKLDEMRVTVNESNSAAAEAERVSYEASATATQASTDAAAAMAAVATLEGLANTDTAQQTLAAQVTQIEANKQGLLVVPAFSLVKETEYDL